MRAAVSASHLSSSMAIWTGTSWVVILKKRKTRSSSAPRRQCRVDWKTFCATIKLARKYSTIFSTQPIWSKSSKVGPAGAHTKKKRRAHETVFEFELIWIFSIFSSYLLSLLVDDSNNFIVFIPADSAFQRWQPLDWGFFPFSVPDFTENILKNHIVFHKKSVDYKVRSEQRFETIGGESVAIRYENSECDERMLIWHETDKPSKHLTHLK